MNLFNIIENWKLTPTKYFISLEDYNYIKMTDEEYIYNILDKMNKNNIKESIINLITSYNPDIVRRIIKTNFTEYLEILDKLLILK